jgi:flavin-dependent dehydrogenase
MLNFMRKPFDHWLNGIAVRDGAVFRDRTRFLDFHIEKDRIVSSISSVSVDKSVVSKIGSRFLIDASGLRPVIRKKLRQEDFMRYTGGGTLNYYIDGNADMDPNTLYQFWNIDYNDAMFAWVYTKTLDDNRDYWVVGTGCISGKLKARQELFYGYIRNNFRMNGNIVKREGYATTLDLRSEDRVWLGEGNILLAGDAAGLIDDARGVGMDSAAISGRCAVGAILESIKSGMPALGIYERYLSKIVMQTKKNQGRGIARIKDNAELTRHLKTSFIRQGLTMKVQAFLNKFRPVEKITLLPP